MTYSSFKDHLLILQVFHHLKLKSYSSWMQPLNQNAPIGIESNALAILNQIVESRVYQLSAWERFEFLRFLWNYHQSMQAKLKISQFSFLLPTFLFSDCMMSFHRNLSKCLSILRNKVRNQLNCSLIIF